MSGLKRCAYKGVFIEGFHCNVPRCVQCCFTSLRGTCTCIHLALILLYVSVCVCVCVCVCVHLTC